MENRQIPYRSIIQCFAELLFGFALVAGPISWMDRNSFFDTRNSDHNEQRWISLESLQDSVNVDLLVLGNSHAYTGVNPKQLSAATGMTSFVLANNGIIMRDAYWNLKSALELCSPQLILVETTLLNGKATKTKDSATLVSSIKSINARSRRGSKLKSCLDLLSFDNLIYAWSPTLLNHHLLLEKPETVQKNILMGKYEVEPSKQKLFLGQHARFTQGLSIEDLALYDSLGPPITSDLLNISDENIEYTQRIIELAESVDAKVAFVALPMFKEHFAAGLDSVRTRQIADLLIPHSAPFLNLQRPPMSEVPEFFQATMHHNQHMTLRGSMVATKLISDWIDNEFAGNLKMPGKAGDAQWHNLFEEQEGYLTYFPAKESNQSVRFLLRNVKTPQMFIDELVVFKDQNIFRDRLDCFIKIDPSKIENKGLPKNSIQIALQCSDTAGPDILTSELNYDQYLIQDDQWIFRAHLPDRPIEGVKAIQMRSRKTKP